MKNLFKVLFLSVLLMSGADAIAKSNPVEDLLSPEAIGLLASSVTEKQDDHKPVKEEGNWVLHHVQDAHDIHLYGEGHSALSVPLPVILWTENGLVTFMSSEFHHDDAGQTVVERNGLSFVKYHEKIYQLNSGASHLEMDHETHEVSNGSKALDFSITKVVVAVFLVAFIMFFVFKSVAKKYKVGSPAAPSGIASWMEPIVLFVRDFAKENIGDSKYMKFMPYLLTVFFFIWFGNLLGLIPFIGGLNMTGNISITLTLALITLIIQLMNSKWAFWKHMLMPPGVPWALYPILVPIELAGILIKPAALTIRLFANITAGHIMVLSIIGIIFTKNAFAWAGLSVPLSLFISVLESTLVAFLQAYIFTMLSSMFIGSAVEEAHH